MKGGRVRGVKAEGAGSKVENSGGRVGGVDAEGAESEGENQRGQSQRGRCGGGDWPHPSYHRPNLLSEEREIDVFSTRD